MVLEKTLEQKKKEWESAKELSIQKKKQEETSMVSVYAFYKRVGQNGEKRKTGKGTREGQCS